MKVNYNVQKLVSILGGNKYSLDLGLLKKLVLEYKACSGTILAMNNNNDVWKYCVDNRFHHGMCNYVAMYNYCDYFADQLHLFCSDISSGLYLTQTLQNIWLNRDITDISIEEFCWPIKARIDFLNKVIEIIEKAL